MSKEIAKCWTFASDSNLRTKSYQTLQYTDGSTSCECRGWTQHAQRVCKHTRAVDMGTADDICKSSHVYKEVAGQVNTALPVTKVTKTKSTAQVIGKRKIEW